ncbi:MAG: chloride channel protein [Thermoanaerobaculia bacterium]
MTRAGASLLERIRLASRRFLLATQVVIGILCGLSAFAFHSLVEEIRLVLISPALQQSLILRTVLVIVIPSAGAFWIAVAIRRFAPGAGGANLARVRRAYGQDPGLLDARSIAATFLLTPISLGSGAPLGPEGPIVVVASGLSSGLARFLRLPRKVARGMIPVGTAAGIAAIFNAPITGVVFALEEVLGTAEKGVLGGAIVAAVAAAVVERSLLGGKPILAAPSATWSDGRELLGFAILGVLAGSAAGLTIRAIERLKKILDRKVPDAALRGGIAGALIGVLALFSPSILGVGYETVSSWLNGGGGLASSALAFGAKSAGYVLALAAGMIGGTFAPSLFMGAALGSTVGHSMKLIFPALAIDPKAYALVGMGAFFAGVLRCPIAAVLIVVEVTGDYGLILPLMLAVSLAIGLSRRVSKFNVVERQLREEGFGGERTLDPLSDMKVADLMTDKVVTVGTDMTILDAARALAGHRHQYYPAIDGEGNLAGVVEAEAIDERARDGDIDARISDLCQKPEVVATKDMPVTDLVRRMGQRGLTRCPVTAGNGSNRLVGFVSPSDLLRARIRSLDETWVDGAADSSRRGQKG